MSDVVIIKDFVAESKRIYSVKVIVYGKRYKSNVTRILPLAVYVLENEEFFIKRICTRCKEHHPKITTVNKLEVYYLRKAGYIQK